MNPSLSSYWNERDGLVLDVLNTLHHTRNDETREKARKSLNHWIENADYLEPSLAARRRGYVTILDPRKKKFI